jgi:hypothetical protein
MLRRLAVPFSVAIAALIFAAPVVAMPPDECPRWCAGQSGSDWQRCMRHCLGT